MKSIRILNETALKVIAIVLMTVDHIAMFLLPAGPIYDIMRSVGRLAMPLFIFMAIEGVYHTRNIRKYFFRLFLIGIAIDVFLVIFRREMIGNMMIDLALGVVLIYFLKKKNLSSLWALIPGALFVLSDFNFTINETRIINTEYGTFGLSIFLAFFIAYEAAGRLCLNKAHEYNIDVETYRELKERSVKNVCCTCALFVVVTVFYLLYRVDYELPILPAAVGMETWCFFSSVFILCYNGRRGYDKAWFKWGSYAYYPLHIVILYLLSLSPVFS